MNKYYGYSAIFVIFLLFGCARESEVRKYKNVQDLKRSTDSSWISSIDAIPLDASNIEVRSEVEMGLGMLSYQTRDKINTVEKFGFKKLSPLHRDLVIDNMLFRSKTMGEIYYLCNSRSVPLDDAGNKQTYAEIFYIGDSVNTQYHWNSLSSDLYKRLCNSSG